jgi:hypothetical protein
VGNSSNPVQTQSYIVLHHGDDLPKWGRGGEGGTKVHSGERETRRSGGELVGGEALTPLSLILGSGAVPIKPVSCGRCNQRVGGVDLPLFNCNVDDLEGGGGGAPFEQGKGMIHRQQRCFGVVTG